MQLMQTKPPRHQIRCIAGYGANYARLDLEPRTISPSASYAPLDLELMTISLGKSYAPLDLEAMTISLAALSVCCFPLAADDEEENLPRPSRLRRGVARVLKRWYQTSVGIPQLVNAILPAVHHAVVMTFASVIFSLHARWQLNHQHLRQHQVYAGAVVLATLLACHRV